MYLPKGQKKESYDIEFDKMQGIIDRSDNEDKANKLNEELTSLRNNIELLIPRIGFTEIEDKIRDPVTEYIKIKDNDEDFLFEKLSNAIPKLTAIVGRILMNNFSYFSSKESDRSRENKENSDRIVEEIEVKIEAAGGSLKQEYIQEYAQYEKDNHFIQNEYEIKASMKSLSKDIQKRASDINKCIKDTEVMEKKQAKYMNYGKAIDFPFYNALQKFKDKGEELTSEDTKVIQREIVEELHKRKVDIEAIKGLYYDEEDGKIVEREIDQGFADRNKNIGVDILKGETFEFCDHECTFNTFSDSVEMKITVEKLESLLQNSGKSKLPDEIKSFSLIIVKDDHQGEKLGQIEENDDDIHPEEHEEAGDDSEEEHPPDDSSDDSEDEDNKGQEEEKIPMFDQRYQDNDSEPEDAVHKIDMSPFLKVLPESLETFTFSCLKYKEEVNLDEVFNLGAFFKGLVMLGIRYFTIRRINFTLDANVEMIKNVFKSNLEYDLIKYISFYECENVCKIDDALTELGNLDNLSFSHCKLDDNCVNDLENILQGYRNKSLNTLGLNHNKFTEVGKKNMEKWVKGDEKSLHIQKIHLYNNCIKHQRGQSLSLLNTIQGDY
ncbi:unnamed protein product [Moneuplotes crassus]|uniref:Uncharacterized protein n=1 Tax=Euplotes crassus TaxID=5936 RepID=A0AAD1Y9C8_EUPCR|nr:unnamed protein product [Moneuplotes crassus]